MRRPRRDDSLHPHLGEVAHALEQAVGHARRSPAARRDRGRAVVVQVDLEDVGRAANNHGELLDGVWLKPRLDAEAVAQRRCQQARARGRPDEREGGQVERDHARPRALAHGDRQAAVLHRGVEGLLEGAWQAVDLVDEEDRAGLERGEERGDVALALERGAGCGDERGVQLRGDDLGQ